MKPTSAAILDVLQKAQGNWVSHSILASVGGHRYGGRIKELRELRHEILQRGAAEHSQYRLVSSPPARTVENSYPRLICACGFAGPSVLFNKFFDECLCPKCGKSVERVAV